jgi:hypothetical protein
VNTALLIAIYIMLWGILIKLAEIADRLPA